MKSEDRPAADPQVVVRPEFEDWGLLFHPRTGEVMGTNAVGMAIFRLLDGRATVEEIARKIQLRFEDSPDTVLTDTLTFLKALRRKMMVTLNRPSTSE